MLISRLLTHEAPSRCFSGSRGTAEEQRTYAQFTLQVLKIHALASQNMLSLVDESASMYQQLTLERLGTIVSTQHVSKPQPTLIGYTSWAFERLVERKSQSAATVAAQIIDDWFDSSREKLETLWHIRFEDWMNARDLAEDVEREVEARLASAKEFEEAVQREVQDRLAKAARPRKVSG